MSSKNRAMSLASLAVTGLGVAFSVSAVVAPNLLTSLYGLIASPDVSPVVEPAGRLGAGIYGGLMAGWGITLWLLGRGSSRTRAAAFGLLTWWGVDSLSSILVGFPGNALSNTAFLALFTPVLIAAFKKSAPASAASTAGATA